MTKDISIPMTTLSNEKMKEEKKKTPSIKKLLQMLIEWHEATNDYKGNYVEFWKKYPSYSLNDLIKIAKQKIN